MNLSVTGVEWTPIPALKKAEEVERVADNLAIHFPFELTIGETPVSGQTKNSEAKETWKRKVGKQAQDLLNEICDQYFLDDRSLMATVYYFPTASMQGDIDNIVKPILDGMIAVAYPDDKLIEKVIVQKFEPGVAWIFSSPSAALAAAIDMQKPSLYIRLDDDLAWRQVS